MTWAQTDNKEAPFRDAKSNLKSTNAMLALQKIAPKQLFLNSHEADLFGGMMSQGSLNPALDAGNNFDGRGISAHIHCALQEFNCCRQRGQHQN